MRFILALLVASSAVAQIVPDSIPFNRVQMKHTHNSYDRDETILDQMLYYCVRSLELDIWPADQPGDWYVEHSSGSKTSCKMLSDCLAIIASINTVIPQHQPVTIWVELKNGKDTWNSNHTPTQFDQLFQKYLGADNLYIPNDLLANCACGGTTCPTLQASVKTCGWPNLDALQNKFFVVLLQSGSGGLSYYDDNTTSDRVAYIQSSASSDPSSDPDRVFFNGDPSATASDFMTRITTANDNDSWNNAVADHYQYLGTDKVNFYVDSWSRTNDPLGWPFRCMSDCGLKLESTRMMYIDAVSAGLGGASDNFTFRYLNASADPTGALTVVAAGPGSGTQAGARGCLMVRGALTSTAPYVAVCRGAAVGEKTLVQWRATEGSATLSQEINANDGDQYDFLRLDITRSGGSTCVTGSAAKTSTSPMTQIGGTCTTANLIYQGIAASANDSTVNAQSPRVRFLFLDLQRGSADVASDALAQKNIGSVASTASSGAGFFPGAWWFTYQKNWGARTNPVGWGGAGQWIAQMTSSGRQDYVYNPDGTQYVNTMLSDGDEFGNDKRIGTRAHGSKYGPLGQFYADVDNDSSGACDLVYNAANEKELWILRNNGSSLGTETLWGTRDDDVAENGRRQWVVNVSTNAKLDYVYNSSSSTKAIRVLVNDGTKLSDDDQQWGSRTYDVNGDAVWLVDVDHDGDADYVYNRKDVNELRILKSTGTGFDTDTPWATPTSPAGANQWIADLNADGDPDYVYSPNGTRELRAMLNKSGALGGETTWGERMYDVGQSGIAQWVTDLNGDGSADYLYNRNGTREYWGMLSACTSFAIDQWWGNRAWPVGESGTAEWVGRLQTSAAHDQINNRDGQRDYWVMVPQSLQSTVDCTP